MAAFSYTTARPAYKALIASAQLRNLFNEIAAYLVANNALGLTFPTSVASAAQYDILVLNAGKTGFDFAKVIRSSTSLYNDQGTGAANKALISDGDTTLNWSYVLRSTVDLLLTGIGSAGQYAQSDGLGGVAWVSSAAPLTWENKTGNFTTANGHRYQCSSAVTSVALHSPALGDEFWIKPAIGNSFETNPLAYTGTPQIAGAASTLYSSNENVIYHFVSNGTNYDVSAEVMDR